MGSEKTESRELAEMEAEWKHLLPQCLEECAAGRVGLFANSPVVSVFVDWPQAERLRSLARKLKEMATTESSVSRFFRYSSLSRDVREEPKLAAEFLEELRREDTSF